MTVKPFDVWMQEYDLTREIRTMPPNLREALKGFLDTVLEIAEQAYTYIPVEPDGDRVQQSKEPGLRTIKNPTAFWLLRSKLPSRLDDLRAFLLDHAGLENPAEAEAEEVQQVTRKVGRPLGMGPVHGTPGCYQSGCREPECRAAHAARLREYRANANGGEA